MITLYTWATPNGFKVSMLLEELGLPYEVVPVNIGAGDQFKPEFLEISPNNKIPAIVDTDGPDGKPISIFESGAILIYLAEKTKSSFLPADPRQRYEVLQWLMWQMGGFGPMLGQAHHFRQYAPERIDYPYDRYTNEAGRLYNVLDKQLGKGRFMVSDTYTIADVATWPWARTIERQGHSYDDFPNVKRWFQEIEARPATGKGVSLLQELRSPQMDDSAKAVLFGAAQYQRR
ncbi:glutathione S-transferase N-terminal domain-containing protein [Fodinicurvata sp. EGI_FJ10296]|uniref:glutathione S-transferase N-terminal domain-containing protein n=1 Tax=Fodinicurvata sp. EGI_FJ10296 TaxID=3231908 RepID=UPI0034554AE3